VTYINIVITFIGCKRHMILHCVSKKHPRCF